MRTLILPALLCGILCGAASAADLVVPSSHYATIQAAIDAARKHDVVVVLPGTYRGDLDFKGKAITVRGKEGRDRTFLQECTVTFAAGEGRDSILEGFHIRYTGSTARPGIRCTSSSPTIRRNRVTLMHQGIVVSGGAPLIRENEIADNTVGGSRQSGWGAGIACGGSNAEIVFNIIRDNDAWSDNVMNPNPSAGGGGILCNGGSPRIAWNLIQGNSARSLHAYGAGIDLIGTTALVENNAIIANELGGMTVFTVHGCGVHSQGGNPIIRGNVIAGNRVVSSNGSLARKRGGGVYCDRGDVVGNTFHANSLGASSLLQHEGGGLYASTSVNVANNIFWKNVATHGASLANVNPGKVRHNFIGSGKFKGQNGNITGDPKFVNAAGGDFHLLPVSPCIDAGTNTLAVKLGPDLDNEPRPVDGRADTVATADMGADEFSTLRRSPVVTRPGTRVPLTIGVAASAGQPYLLACSLGVSTGFPLPDQRRFPLDADALFLASLGRNNAVFTAFTGVLDSKGGATAALDIPASPQLLGLRVYPGGATWITGGKVIILNYLEIVVVP